MHAEPSQVNEKKASCAQLFKSPVLHINSFPAVTRRELKYATKQRPRAFTRPFFVSFKASKR